MINRPKPPTFLTTKNTNGITICNDSSSLVKYCEDHFKMTHVEIANACGTSAVTIMRYKKSGRAKLEPAHKLYEYIEKRYKMEQSKIPLVPKLQEIEGRLKGILTEIQMLISIENNEE